MQLYVYESGDEFRPQTNINVYVGKAKHAGPCIKFVVVVARNPVLLRFIVVSRHVVCCRQTPDLLNCACGHLS